MRTRRTSRFHRLDPFRHGTQPKAVNSLDGLARCESQQVIFAVVATSSDPDETRSASQVPPCFEGLGCKRGAEVSKELGSLLGWVILHFILQAT